MKLNLLKTKRVLAIFILCLSTFILNAGKTNIYPNPAKNNFVVNTKFEVKSLEVFDLLNTKVLSKIFDSYSKQNIDISELSAGRYFVKVS